MANGSAECASRRSPVARWRGRVFVATLLAVGVLLSGSRVAAPASPVVSGAGPVVSSSSTQVVVGIAEDWQSTSATLQSYERVKGRWRSVGSRFTGRLGPNGLAWGRGLHPSSVTDAPGAVAKREGDKRSPAGVFTLPTAFGYDPAWATRTRLPYVTVGPRDLFGEDPSSPDYNTHDRLDHDPATDEERKQQMYQTDPAHRLEVLVGHNVSPAPVPGAGSAIFIHSWRGQGARTTTGCTAVSDAAIDGLVRWLDPAAHPLYVLLPRAEYEARRHTWGLPDLASAV